MTNEIPATIIVPKVPDDFNGGVGREFAVELLELLKQVGIKFNPVTTPDTFDAAKLVQSVADLNTKFDKSYRKVRKVIVNCIADAAVPVAFADIGTILYSVQAILIVPVGSPPPTGFSLSLLADSKTTTTCSIYCKGALAPFQAEVTITEVKDDV